MIPDEKPHSTRKSRRVDRATELGDEAGPAETATEPVASESPAAPPVDTIAPVDDAVGTTRKRPRRRRSASRRKAASTTETVSAATVPTSAASVGTEIFPPPEAEAPTAPPVKPHSPAARVEAIGEAVIIRFPPVAPPPFAAPLPTPAPETVRAPKGVGRERLLPEPPPKREEPEVLPPTVAVTEELEGEPEPVVAEEHGEGGVEAAAETRLGRRRRRRGGRRRGKAGEARPEVAGAEVVQPAEAPRVEVSRADESQLSPSQRRRLRRKRRLERGRGGAPGDRRPAEPGEPPTILEREETGPPDSARHEEPEHLARTGAATWAEEVERPEAASEEHEAEPDATRVELAAFDDREEEAEAPSGKPTKEMIINVFPREECRIAILKQGVLEEIYIERASAENHVGNIYKGIVTNVEPSIQAAFVDFGLGKNGFLHISDLHPQYFPDGGQPAENVGCKIPRRHRPPIQRCLRRGQQVIAQITKEGIGTKGPTLSTYLSIPGRFLVMMPGMRRLGVSRKIEDDEARHKLRTQLSELELPEGMGFIARTAAQGRTRRELQSDLKYLVRLWRAVEKRIQTEKPPAELYRESDLVIRTIRDLYSSDIGRIIVDDPVVAERAREFLRIFSPRSGDVVHEYKDSQPIFHKFGVEAELERLHSRHVPLKSGGSLVIDQTEALVAVDVNSGRFRTEDDAEATAFKINLEAADEIARQLRLRDLGGVIICDFIDMRLESHKREIERRLAKNLKEHKERAKILRMSAFGVIEMTRQRQRASITHGVYQDCYHCRGTGLVRTAESVALDVLRTLQVSVARDSVYLIEIAVSPDVALLLLNRKRSLLYELEAQHRRTITIRPNPQFGLDQVEIRCWDQRGRAVPQA